MTPAEFYKFVEWAASYPTPSSFETLWALYVFQHSPSSALNRVK